ncbi:MAG: hypothetical protein WCT52_03435 [Candidatus Micrarchaeia archaeon]
MPNCLSCGAGIDEYDSGYYSRSMLCIPCYTAKMSEVPMANCGKCGMRIRRDDARSRGGGIYCNYCFSELDRVERLPKCEDCERRIESWQKSIKSAEGRFYHAECAQKMKDKRVMAVCSFCGTATDRFRLSREGKVMCSRCSAREARPHASSPNNTLPAREHRPLLASFIDRIGQMIG